MNNCVINPQVQIQILTLTKVWGQFDPKTGGIPD